MISFYIYNMDYKKTLNKIKERRKKRTRAKFFGVSGQPRLAVFRSNQHCYAQLIDDEKGSTLVSASTGEIKEKLVAEKNKKISLSELLGELIAKRAIEKGIKKAVFDRRDYKYHGRVRAVAEGARKGGLRL